MSLKRFTADRHAAVQFFSEKIASQWNNPTFQSYWIAETSTSGIEESGLVWAFTSPKGSYYGAGYLNLLQFVILAGALFYCMSACMKGTEPEGAYTCDRLCRRIFVPYRMGSESAIRTSLFCAAVPIYGPGTGTAGGMCSIMEKPAAGRPDSFYAGRADQAVLGDRGLRHRAAYLSGRHRKIDAGADCGHTAV